MGYSTSFSGEWTITPPLEARHAQYLRAFNETRRMTRNAVLTAQMPDGLRERAMLPVGEEGGYYVGARGPFGQDLTPDILDYNRPPAGQPGLWCQWTPNEDGTALVWDEGEKFYFYVEWLTYLIGHFLEPWGYRLNGEVRWQGEDSDDRGVIYVRDNQVAAALDRITNEPPWSGDHEIAADHASRTKGERSHGAD
jgi:hypothetical protein